MIFATERTSAGAQLLAGTQAAAKHAVCTATVHIAT